MTSHTHRKDASMTDPPTIESTLVTHTDAVERRFDLLKRCSKIVQRVGVRLTSESLIELVKFVEEAHDPTERRLVLPSVGIDLGHIDPEGFAILTGQAVPPGTPGASRMEFVGYSSDVQTVDNNVGDGSDVDTDVWPSAVPPPDYDNLDDGQGDAPVTYAKFDDEAGGGTECCPRCGSPDKRLHPAMQHEGEVQPCPNLWHDLDRADPSITTSTTSDDAVSSESTDGKDD